MNHQKITKHIRRKYYQYSPTLVHITGGQVYVILNQVPMSNHSHKVYCGSIQSVLDEACSERSVLSKIYLQGATL